MSLPFDAFVKDLVDADIRARRVTARSFLAPTIRPAKGAPVALLMSPHPDDECIVGGLALRLRDEGWRILNIGVTLGSRADRREPRRRELAAACKALGFDLLVPGRDGLHHVNAKTRASLPAAWQRNVAAIATILQREQPRVILAPHRDDWNTTHVGVHLLLRDALAAVPRDHAPWLVETEFWGQLSNPNLAVELTPNHVTRMVSALALHRGEVARNPYHLRLPAWLQDNVRRGAERVGEQGGSAPDFHFATLYCVRRWTRGRALRAWTTGRFAPASETLRSLFPGDAP